jgi:dTDP-4-dehydrorhamnose 3,5-epimerase/CDP-3, 6-dideoxy-D-glycero-D-glycero-4-hexulose-5-epimerase
MRIEETGIDGAKLIHLNRLDDNRGTFIKHFNDDFFRANDLRTDFKESYFSVSQKNVIRGMHFQTPPALHTKLVFVNNGSIIDVILDLRKSSITYGRFFSITVSMEAPALIYIPEGCAHGFLSLEDNTIVSYLQTSVYNKECDHGVRWNSFGFDWKIAQPVISDRDKSFNSFKEFKSPFE